jgi:hypothetical protein
MKHFKFALAVAVALAASTAHAESPKPLEVLSNGANAYASQHLMQIYAGSPIDDEITVDPGTAYGQVMHPSIDQLKTLGYVPDRISGGDVRLEFSPAGCVAKERGECDLLVHAAVPGDENLFSIPLRTRRRADDNPIDSAVASPAQ